MSGTSGGPARLEPEAATGRSHLSSDPRIRTARALLERNRFAEALEILRSLAPDHPDQDGRGVSPGPGGQPGVPGARGSRMSNGRRSWTRPSRRFRSILIRRPGLVRVRLELALAFYFKQEDSLAREHFERALVGKPPEALVENVTQLLKVIRARRRWDAWFGFSIAPDTNINAASDAEFIYINNLPFRRGATGRASTGHRHRGLGRRWNTSIRWPNAGGCVRV